jgi:hypothetical protein
MTCRPASAACRKAAVPMRAQGKTGPRRPSGCSSHAVIRSSTSPGSASIRSRPSGASNWGQRSRSAGMAPKDARTGQRYPSPPQAAMTCRRCSPRNRSARHFGSSGSTAATDCPWYPRTGTSWKAGSPAKACCTPSPAGSPAPPPKPRTRRPPPTRARRRAGRARAPARPAARLPHRRDHHHRGLTAGRPETGRRQLAAGRHPGVGAGSRLRPPGEPGHHPGSRGPRQPAGPRHPGPAASGHGTARSRTGTSRQSTHGRERLAQRVSRLRSG